MEDNQLLLLIDDIMVALCLKTTFTPHKNLFKFYEERRYVSQLFLYERINTSWSIFV